MLNQTRNKFVKHTTPNITKEIRTRSESAEMVVCSAAVVALTPVAAAPPVLEGGLMSNVDLRSLADVAVATLDVNELSAVVMADESIAAVPVLVELL